MIIDTDRLRARLKELKPLESGNAMMKFAIWARTAETTRALETIEDFWTVECADIKKAMEHEAGLCTRVLHRLGIEELSRDECLFLRCRFWRWARRGYEYFLVQARHVCRIIKDRFNWSRHP